jgi:hypothetical protein
MSVAEAADRTVAPGAAYAALLLHQVALKAELHVIRGGTTC